ncbi:MAG: DUF3426 domain-containing protein [Acidobacteria bacterium]|nr:DUF3426 domain-containing protein [Acidobacteriota bacterium]
MWSGRRLRSNLPVDRFLVCLALVLFLFTPSVHAQDDGVIRLGPRISDEPATEPITGERTLEGEGEGRRGFNYEQFETRLESLWFQRKAFLADGADDKAKQQAELIKAFCYEEGIRRLERLAGALLAETQRHLSKGRYNRALAALDLAQAIDPGRAQIHFARASVYWQAAGRNGAAAGELFKGIGAVFTGSILDLSLFRRVALTFVVALAGTIFVFSLTMVSRYQAPFRHEVEEVMLRFADERLARPAGWIALVLALVVVIGGGLAGRNQIVAAWPQAAQLYDLVGLSQESPAPGLELRNVQQSSFVENDQTIVVVSGEIANLSSRTVRLPNIVAQVMDKDERILESWILTPASTQLGPGETIEFSDRFADPPKGAVRLLVVFERKS